MIPSVNALEVIDAELAKAAAPKPSNKRPVFLFLKENHKALIRPLFILKDALVLKRHNKYSENADQRINSICATEIGKPCVYCEQSAHDKKLSANLSFYLPVYVYSVFDTKTEQQVTFKEKIDDKDVEKPVTGIRVLELTSFGTIGAILKFFREFTKDADSEPITEYDFTISQVGSGQTKTFVCLPKAPTAMNPKIKAIIPGADRFRERILEALPPASSVVQPTENADLQSEAVVQSVNNSQQSQGGEGNDGVIPEF